MKLDFLIVAPEIDFTDISTYRAWPIARSLKRRGYDVGMLTLSEAVVEADDIPIFHLDYPKRVTAGETFSEDIALRYGIKDYRDFAYCEYRYREKEFRSKTYAQLAAEVPAAFSEVDRLFEQNDIACVLHPYMGGEIIRRTTSRVAQKRNIRTLYHGGTQYFPDRTLLVTDDFGSLPSRPALRYQDLPADKKQYISDYLEQKRASKPVVGYGNPERRFTSLAKSFMRQGKFKDMARLRKGLSTALQYLHYERSKFHWKAPDEEKPYLYFPLHYPVESNIILRSPWCLDQGELISQLASALPDSLEIAAKQHPYNPAESVSYHTIKRIVQLSNTRLLPATMSSWDLVSSCCAVVTIHGTAGFEALLLRRPVIVLGHPPYRGWGVTKDVSCVDEFPSALERATNSPALTEERLLDFLASFESIHVPGNWFDAKPDPDEMAEGVITIAKRLRS